MVIAICGRDDDTGVCFTLATKGKDCYNHLVEERQRTDLSVGRRKPEDVHDDGSYMIGTDGDGLYRIGADVSGGWTRKVPKREKFAKRGYDFEDHMCG